MRIRLLMCAAMVVAGPASAQDMGLGIELLPGHPIYHEREHEAGVAMALAITPGNGHGPDLAGLCEELRAAAELGDEHGDGLRLETVFVVPYKGMAVEGYYWPDDGSLEEKALVRGGEVGQSALYGILARAGIPPSLLDETNVKHEISCSLDEPFWYVAWYDVRLIGDEAPDAVIERARHRFLALHQSVVEHRAQQQLQTAQRRPARRG